MSHDQWWELIRSQRAIAVIRSKNMNTALKMAQAVAHGGMGLIEITWNSDQPATTIAHLRQEFPHCLIGVGTILTVAELAEAIAAGSQFVFTPHTNLTIIEQALNAHIPIIPGALTPTEILTAYQAGSTAVKVFPIDRLGGTSYIKALQGPLGHIPLIPTGGVTIDNAITFIQSGSVGVGLSGDLFPQALVNNELWTEISDRARYLLGSVNVS